MILVTLVFVIISNSGVQKFISFLIIILIEHEILKKGGSSTIVFWNFSFFGSSLLFFIQKVLV